jgi:hypothetical protein
MIQPTKIHENDQVELNAVKVRANEIEKARWAFCIHEFYKISESQSFSRGRTKLKNSFVCPLFRHIKLIEVIGQRRAKLCLQL